MICRGIEHRAQHAAPLQAALLEVVQRVVLKTNHHLLFKAVLHKLEGDITRDLRAYDDLMIQLLDSSPQPLIHALCDVGGVTTFAPLSEALALRCIYHSKSGWTVTIGAIHNPVMRMLASMTLSIAKLRFRETETMESACRILQERVSGLPDLQQAWVALKEQTTKGSV